MKLAIGFSVVAVDVEANVTLDPDIVPGPAVGYTQPLDSYVAR